MHAPDRGPIPAVRAGAVPAVAALQGPDDRQPRLVRDPPRVRHQACPTASRARRLRADEREQDRHHTMGADQMELEPPEVPGVRRAVAVLRLPGRIRAVAVPREQPASDRGGVDDPHVVAPQRGAGRQQPDHVFDQAARAPGAACRNRTAGASRGTGGGSGGAAQPATLGGVAEQRRHHS
jgi:hypothetical protein